MYSTKRLHKEGGAYVSLGDTYTGEKSPVPERWKGKRLSCPAHPPAYFTPFSYASEPYYVEGEAGGSQPPAEERKVGFGSRGGRKTDEFAVTRKMEAYREVLRKEAKLNNTKHKGGSKEGQTPPSSPTTSSATGQQPRSFLYDIGRERTTAFNPKLRRDTYYKQDGRGRRLGPYRLTSKDVGQGIWATQHVPPEVRGGVVCSPRLI